MRIPVATYRLQFNPSFGFRDARRVAAYLSELGISDIYASPILKATEGSTHGYDVTDPDELNPELGTPDDFQALTAEVQARGMGWLQDIVPNHMGYSSRNWMLMDVFENGPRSRFYNFFDIFRDHPDPELRTRVLAPFLGGPLEEVLKRGEVQLALDGEGLAIRYFTWRFPLYLPTYESVLWGDGLLQSGSVTDGGTPPQEFCSLHDSFAHLANMDDSPDKRRLLAQAKQMLARLHSEHPAVHQHIDRTLEFYNRPRDGPIAQSPLYRLLEQQLFKLVFWQVAYEKINYRRFLYISEFIALRTEEPDVFERVHSKIFELVRAGVFTGLRIDYVDGLYNPRGYLVRLHNTLPECYLVVEKILELYEFLSAEWPIQGTSGYKFCNYLNGIFCRRENEDAFTRIYHEFIGGKPDYEQLLYNEKKKTLQWRMAGEVAYLAHLAMQASRDPGLTIESAQTALTALMAAFPVYRTYVDAQHFTQHDRMRLAESFGRARSRCPECRPDIDRIIRLLLPDAQEESDPTMREARRYFLMRFQQFTGPAMAKGCEDTLLYVYNRFISLNEVGGDPTTFGLALDRYHWFNESRIRFWPHAMSATSTHDSKRGEDVRARLNVLSEIPQKWREAVTRWARMNERHKQPHDNVPAPDRNDEYLLYQTLVGAWPFDEREVDGFRQRIKDYMVKAVREAKTYSNWVQPNERYEGACRQFIDRILDSSAGNSFWPDFLAFQKEISEYGVYNSLSQTILKITGPGLPDFYQGSELWNLHLVDPDNRRPVDFDTRAQFLREFGEAPANTHAQFVHVLMSEKQDGRAKLFLIHKCLACRRENRDLFQTGEYVAASVSGTLLQHVISFFRAGRDRYALTVAPRFLTSLIRPGQPPAGRDVWRDTRIALPLDAASDWHDAITGNVVTARGEVFLRDILSDFPVCLLIANR